MQMADKAGLSANHAVSAKMGRAADANLSSQRRVFAYFNIVGQMDKVVELNAFVDMCGTHCGTVDSGVGTDLHVVVDHHVAHLRDLLVMAILLRSEAESISANYGTGMDDAAFTDHGISIQTHAWVQGRIVAND